MVETNKHYIAREWDGIGFQEVVEMEPMAVQMDKEWRKQTHEVPNGWEKNRGGAASDFTMEIGIQKSDVESFAKKYHLHEKKSD